MKIQRTLRLDIIPALHQSRTRTQSRKLCNHCIRLSIAALVSSSLASASAGGLDGLGVDSGGLPTRSGATEAAIEEGTFIDVNTSPNEALICAASAEPGVRVAVIASSGVRDPLLIGEVSGDMISDEDEVGSTVVRTSFILDVLETSVLATRSFRAVIDCAAEFNESIVETPPPTELCGWDGEEIAGSKDPVAIAGEAAFEDKEAGRGPSSGGDAVGLCSEVDIFDAAIFEPVSMVTAVDTERRLVVKFATSL